MRGRRKLKIQIRLSPNGKTKIKPTKKQRETGVAASHPDFPSTNISSPIQAASRRRAKQANKAAQMLELRKFEYVNEEEDHDIVVNDDEYEAPVYDAEDDSEDDFEPVREKGKTRVVSKRPLGPPITTDEKIERLPELHRAVVEDFLIAAKEESRKVCSARIALREMLIATRYSLRRA